MDERLEPEIRNRIANRAQIVERVLPRQDDPGHTEVAHNGRTSGIVHRDLRRSVDLEIRIHDANQANQSQILDDHRVDAMVDRVTQQHEGVGELPGLVRTLSV